jgi:hypothetical protein
MTVNGNDLLLVYSGGDLNSSPYDSLGGEPSSFPVNGVLNNLFENLTDEEMLNKNIDYKCLYLINNNNNNSFFNLRIFIDKSQNEFTNIQLGIKKTKEIQRLTLNYEAITGGIIAFTYNNITVNANWSNTGYIFANNIKNSLNNIFKNVETCLIEKTDTKIIIDIKFDDEDDYRFHDLLNINIENLISENPKTFSISRTSAGAPINYIHDSLENKNTVPYGVVFDDYNSLNPLLIGTLQSNEYLPLWFKRTSVKSSGSMSNDNFNLRIISNPI